MTCQEIAEFLMDYLNGELPDGNRVVFEQHLGECPDCVAYLQSYQATVKLCGQQRGTAPVDPPEELVQAILTARRRSSIN